MLRPARPGPDGVARGRDRGARRSTATRPRGPGSTGPRSRRRPSRTARAPGTGRRHSARGRRTGAGRQVLPCLARSSCHKVIGRRLRLDSNSPFPRGLARGQPLSSGAAMVTSPVALNTAGSLVPSRPAPDSIARRRRAGLAGIVLILALAAPRGGAAAPERPAPQWIGPRDMTDVLAAGKIRSFSRMLARMQVATANQNAFDVTYYDLDLHPNPANSVLTATVRTRASVVAGPVSTLELDFDNT